MPVKNKKNELSVPKSPEEVGHTNDPKSYLYHRIVSHPTKDCFMLKDKIQALAKTDVLCLITEKK